MMHLANNHRHARCHSEAGVGLILVVVVTTALTALVGVSAGLVMLDRSSGCAGVMQRIEDNDYVSEAEYERCRTAFRDQLQIAAAGANFIPSGADVDLPMQMLSAHVDRASATMPVADAPLPSDIQNRRDDDPAPDASVPDSGIAVGGDFELLSYNTSNGVSITTPDPDAIPLKLRGTPSHPTISWTGISEVVVVSVVAQSETSPGEPRVVFGIRSLDDPDTLAEIPLVSPVTYGDYSSQGAVGDAAQVPSPPLQTGYFYSLVVGTDEVGYGLTFRLN